MSGIHDVEVFVHVVEHEGFTAGARALGITKSYASKLVSRLEARLGVRLLQRNTRRLALTPEGQVFYDRAVESLSALAAAEEEVSSGAGSVRGRLRITVPTGFGHQHLVAPLLALKRAHPDVDLDVVYADRLVDLVGEGFDLAVRAGVLPDSSLVARRLARVEQIVCASDDYLARHGEPATPADLAGHTCLRYTYEANPGVWPLTGPDGEEVAVRVGGSLMANNGLFLVGAAVEGLGIAFSPLFHVGRELRDGRLRHILRGWRREMGVYAVYPQGRHLPLKVRVAVDHLVAHFREPAWASLMSPSG